MRTFAVVFSPAALDDLAAIRDHISGASSPTIANAFVDRLVRYCEGLARAPHRGTTRDSVRSGLRVVGWRRTVTIAFAVDEAAERVDVAGVFYRGRDVASAVAKR
jgi:toxin ParE1/3/4